MKVKKFLIVALMAVLSLSLMACPSVVNLEPQIVIIEGDEIIEINEIVYEHVKGSEFSVDIMLQNLFENQGLAGIDYDQSGIAIGSNRRYDNISDHIVVETFYAVWSEQEPYNDANGDGVVDEADEPFYGDFVLDDDGNNIYDVRKMDLVTFKSVGDFLEFTLQLTDDDGVTVELDGIILIVAE